eukprot:COSAG01_NODE_491_length_16354_cov_26.550784_3_plen_191_part_00
MRSDSAHLRSSSLRCWSTTIVSATSWSSCGTSVTRPSRSAMSLASASVPVCDWMLCGSPNGYLLSRGGCPNRWHSLVSCDHGDSTTGRFLNNSPAPPAGASTGWPPAGGAQAATARPNTHARVNDNRGRRSRYGCWGEIMAPIKFDNVGKSQPVLMMITPMISPRTRGEAGGRGAAASMAARGRLPVNAG